MCCFPKQQRAAWTHIWGVKRLISFYVCIRSFILFEGFLITSVIEGLHKCFVFFLKYFTSFFFLYLFLHLIERASLASPPGHGHLSAHDSSLLQKKREKARLSISLRHRCLFSGSAIACLREGTTRLSEVLMQWENREGPFPFAVHLWLIIMCN